LLRLSQDAVHRLTRQAKTAPDLRHRQAFAAQACISASRRRAVGARLIAVSLSRMS
jgi:hypothetical protein